MILCCIVQSKVNKNHITLYKYFCVMMHVQCGFSWLVSALLLELVGTCFSVSESVHQLCSIVREMVETLCVN
jgi:hypothetical protein